MSVIPRSTVEQWAVLRAVVEQGSFAAAAEALHRSQSSVSYTVARLQEAVGAHLLEICGRRARLTPIGTVLLAEAMPLIDDLARIERRGQGVARGQPESIRLLVDTLFPKERLFRALTAFAARWPDIELHLTETVRQTVEQVPKSDFDVAVLIGSPGARDVDPIAAAQMIAVARHDHPLAAPLGEGRSLGPAALARYARVEFQGQILPDDRPAEAGRSWRMGTVDSAIGAVRAGLCYGWLPHDRIRDALRLGELRALPLASGGVRQVDLVLVCAEPMREVPAIAELAAVLAMAEAAV